MTMTQKRDRSNGTHLRITMHSSGTGITIGVRDSLTDARHQACTFSMAEASWVHSVLGEWVRSSIPIAADYRAQTILRKIINESEPLTLLHTHFTEEETAYMVSLVDEDD